MSRFMYKGLTIKQWFKKGCVLYPEIMAAHALSTFGLVGYVVLVVVQPYLNHIPRTFERPLFLRPQDPKAKKTITFYEDGWDEKYP